MCALAWQNARSDRVCLDFSLLLSLYQDKESKYRLRIAPTCYTDAFENVGGLTVILFQPLCVTPGRSGPLGPVPITGLLWPLPKSATPDLCCRDFARHRTQRGPSTGTDVCFFSEHAYLQSFSKKAHNILH
jgi:hypothetical protein